MREVARRVFAREYAESNLQERAGDTEYAPSYIITPTGAKCNRLFIIGVLTEVTEIGNDKELYRARVSDPTGEFLLYAGNFQPEATKFLSDARPPLFVAVTGKSNLYQPDEETSITSIRPEAINESSESERDRWVVKTAEKTLKRMKEIDERIKSYYDYDETEYIKMIEESLNSVTGDEEKQVSSMEIEEDKTEEKKEKKETEEIEEKEPEAEEEETKRDKSKEETDENEEQEKEEEEEKEIEELDLTDI